MNARYAPRAGNGPPAPPFLLTTRSTALLAVLCASLVAASTALAASATFGKAQYSGQTSGSSTVRLRVSNDGKQVAKMRVFYSVTCDDGRKHTTFTDILNLTLRKGGKFAGMGSYTGTGDGSKNNFKVTGTVAKTHAKGTFTLTATGTDQTTHATVSCQTGALTWSAKRQR